MNAEPGFDGRRRTPTARRPYHLAEVRECFCIWAQPVGAARRVDREICFLENGIRWAMPNEEFGRDALSERLVTSSATKGHQGRLSLDHDDIARLERGIVALPEEIARADFVGLT